MSDPDMTKVQYRKGIRRWVNIRRRLKGKKPVWVSTPLNHEAQRRVEVLADTDQFYHQSLEPVWEVFPAEWVAETLYIGPDNFRPREVVRAWMRSAPHREILLKDKAEFVGIGAAWDEDRDSWVISMLLANKEN